MQYRGYRMNRRRASAWLSIFSAISGYLVLVCAAPCDQEAPTTYEVEVQGDLSALRGAVNCTNGGQIEATWRGTVSVLETMMIGTGTVLTVNGIDGAEAIASSNTRLFQVDSDGGLQITNMTLSGGSAEEGGAILSESGAVSVQSCELYNNTATSGGGGAIWARGGSVNITGSYFHNNTAFDQGGAVYAIDVDLNVRDDARFEHNWAEEGGALFCGGSESVSSSVTSCSFDGVEFLANNASSVEHVDLDEFGYLGWAPPWEGLNGGGGLSLVNTTAVLRSCSFESNYAQVSGAGVHSGLNTMIFLENCTFSSNYAQGFGGGATISSANFDGSTSFEYNDAGRHGAAVFAWDGDARVEMDSLRCLHNTAGDQGGCLYTAAGDTQVYDEVLMEDNNSTYGGCIYVAMYSTTTITGGNYTCRVTGNGAFLFTSSEGTAVVEGGLVKACVAERRAGVAYCSGATEDQEGSRVTIAGGTFIDNEAWELGGALVAWGTTLAISGGLFANNSARYYGGFVFLEEQASLTCEGATIRENYAGDQGGGVYARDAVNVNLSRCDLLDNESLQGPTAYLTHVELASFHNLSVFGNIPSGGASVFIAETLLIADEVTFDAGNASNLDTTNRAVQSDASSSFHAHDCSFESWNVYTVVSHGGQSSGSLKINTCDFRRSSSSMMVMSSQSEAEIRNAHVSQDTFDNAIDPFALVDNALSCNSQGACGDGACVNSSLGVLCYCLPPADGGACLDDGPTLWLEEESAPADATIYPQNVEFMLAVYADTDGSTDAIWEVTSSSDRLELSVVPSSGVISPGEKIVIAVTGVPVDVNTGGDVTNTFVLTTVTNGSSGSDGGSSGSSDSSGGSGRSGGSSSTGEETTDTVVNVISAVYLCDAFEMAMPDSAALVSCVQCSGLKGAEGVDCKDPGATLELLPIIPGYWRSSNESANVLSCDLPEACAGGTEVTTSDGYCAPGYVGPYCAVCAEGYGRGIGSRCHACTGTTASLLIVLGVMFCLVATSFIFLIVMFLIGGLDAVDLVRDSIVSSLTLRPGGASRRASTSSVTGSVRSSFRTAGGMFFPLTSATTQADGKSRYEMNVETSKTGERVEWNGASAPEECLQMVGAGKAAESGGARTPSSKDGLPRRVEETGSSQQVGRRRTYSVDGAGACESGKAGMESKRGSNVIPHAAPVEEERSGCCGLGETIKRWMSRLPLDKLKILVVVWQILTVFPNIASVEFPPVYANFLSWIDVINLDLGHIFSASCLISNISYYERLLAVTLIPLLLGLVLAITYRMALRRAGIGTAGMIARRAAWSRHVTAGLLLTFLVFTSVSTTIFRTFSCDDHAVEGKSFLRADYSVECGTPTYTVFVIYAGLMILVYPVGIPVLYFFILWKNRASLNPTLRLLHPQESDDEDEDGESPEEQQRQRQQKQHASATDEAQECDDPTAIEEKIRQRKMNPDLVPSMFLWRDYGPDLYYYEVIECGRRILLTGVLIFIKPQSSTQAAMACIFAFATLLGFEQLRPHLDPADSWLYRLGCVVIFLSNFLALLVKVDAAGSGRRDVLGALIVAVNVVLVGAVIVTSWFTTQQSVDDSRGEDNSFAVAKSMVTAERLAANSVRTRRDRERTLASSRLAQRGPILDAAVPSASSAGPTVRLRPPRPFKGTATSSIGDEAIASR